MSKYVICCFFLGGGGGGGGGREGGREGGYSLNMLDGDIFGCTNMLFATMQGTLGWRCL